MEATENQSFLSLIEKTKKRVEIMLLICLIPYILSELMLWSLDIVSVTYVVCILGLNSNTLPCVIVVFVIYSEYGSDLLNYLFLFWISAIVSLDIASIFIMVLIHIPCLVLSVLYVYILFLLFSLYNGSDLFNSPNLSVLFLLSDIVSGHFFHYSSDFLEIVSPTWSAL